MERLDNKGRRLTMSGETRASGRSSVVMEVSAFVIALLMVAFTTKGVKDGLLVIGLITVITRCVRSRIWPSFGGIGLALATSTVVMGVAAYSSELSSGRKLLEWLVPIACFFTLVNLAPGPGPAQVAVRNLARAMLAYFLIMELPELITGHSKPENLNAGDGRWMASEFGYPTIAGALWSVGVAVSIAAAAGLTRGFERVLHGLGALMMVFLIVKMQADSALMLAIPGAIAVIFLFTRGARFPVWLKLYAVPAALGVVALLALILTVSSAQQARPLELAKKALSGRQEIWEVARAEIAEKPWTGHGLGHGTFTNAFYVDRQRAIPQKNVLDHAHNMILEIAYQAGLPGLLSWLLVIWASARRIISGYAEMPDLRSRLGLGGLAAGLVALLLYGQLSLFFSLRPIYAFWCLLGLALAAVDRREAAPGSGSG